MGQTITIRLKLRPPSQGKAARLAALQLAFAEACRYFASVSKELGTTVLGHVHRAAYREGRARFDLNTGVLQQAMQKALAARRSVRTRQRKGKKASEPKFRSVPVMVRNDLYRVVMVRSGFGLKLPTGSGRSQVVLPMAVGEYQRRYLSLLASGGAKQGSGELFRSRSGIWYFHLTLDIPCEKAEPGTVIGVDLGVVNLATVASTDGSLNVFHGGKPMRWRRERLAARRAHLQARGRLARLKREKGKETRWMTYHNHVISKRIVQLAKARHAAIVLEDLAGIRDRSKLGKRGNRMIASWAFRQLVAFVVYKAELAGVSVRFIDPRGTSKACSHCGGTDKGNRKEQARFRCLQCGFRLHADLNAARNIAHLGSMAAGQAPAADGSVTPRKAPGPSHRVQADLSASPLGSLRHWAEEEDVTSKSGLPA